MRNLDRAQRNPGSVVSLDPYSAALHAGYHPTPPHENVILSGNKTPSPPITSPKPNSGREETRDERTRSRRGRLKPPQGVGMHDLGRHRGALDHHWWRPALARHHRFRAGCDSFDAGGVHFIGLVNVVDLKAGGLGNLGAEQLAWLEDDLRGKSKSTPIVLFAHIPLWTVYPEWGWGTEDGGRALEYVKGFGSVTVLNGHIHQVMQKVEGNVTFHTARSTAFPQPAPGAAPSPGPMKVEDAKLRSMLGVASVNFK